MMHAVFMLSAKSCRESEFNIIRGILAVYGGIHKYSSEVGIQKRARVFQRGMSRIEGIKFDVYKQPTTL